MLIKYRASISLKELHLKCDTLPLCRDSRRRDFIPSHTMKKTLLLLTLVVSLGLAYAAESNSSTEEEKVTLTFSNTVAASASGASIGNGGCKGIAFTLKSEPSRLAVTCPDVTCVNPTEVHNFNVFDLESISLKVNTAWTVATGAYLIDDGSNEVVALSSSSPDAVTAGGMATFTFGNVSLNVNKSYKLFFVNKTDMTNTGIAVGTKLEDAVLIKSRSVKMLLSGMEADSQAECAFTNALDSYVDGTGSYAPIVSIQGQAWFVPEPTTATLSLLALAGLIARRRRK